MKSRRQFLKLVAAGSAAALTGNARTAAAAAKRAARAAHAAGTAAKAAPAAAISPAVREEVEKQKKSTADALKVIRDYPLPAGSPMAFSFAAMRVKRKGGR